MPLRTLQGLIEGFRSFRETYYDENRALFEALVLRGQAPKVMIIGCADSRVDPLLITGAGPGDLFVVRNVANLVPPYAPSAQYHGTSAAIEFAVRGLAVEHIVILGHAQCGGVRALLEGPSATGDSDFIPAWMSIAEPARRRALQADVPEAARSRTCELESIKVSLGNLETFPWLKARLESGTLSLHGWYFDLTDGSLLGFDPARRDFRPL